MESESERLESQSEVEAQAARLSLSLRSRVGLTDKKDVQNMSIASSRRVWNNQPSI